MDEAVVAVGVRMVATVDSAEGPVASTSAFQTPKSVKSVKSVKSQAKSRENLQKSRESRENGPRGKVWGVGSTNLGPQNHKKPYIKCPKNPKARSDLQEMKKSNKNMLKNQVRPPKAERNCRK